MAHTYKNPGMCWAKLRRDCLEGSGKACRKSCDCEVTGLLSLVGHSADVAAVYEALLEQPVIASRLARLLNKDALSVKDRAAICALAALHDLGKISQGFQHAPFDRTSCPRGHIAPFLAVMVNNRNDIEAKAFWRQLEDAGGLASLAGLIGKGAGWFPLKAALAHHGSLPNIKTGPTPLLWRVTPDHDPVAAARTLIDAIRLWFPAAFDGARLDWTPRFGHAFAGLLTLADWLGSDAAVFPLAGVCGAPDGVGRYAWAREKAATLLASRLLAPERARAACGALRWAIEPLTGFKAASTAQAAILALPPPPIEGRICLIEDETGSGKTEAALIHFLRLFDEGSVDGLYFALPTRAAAVQIHRRIEKLLNNLLGDAVPGVVLAVPGYLDRTSDTAAQLPGEATLWPDSTKDALEDAAWASARPKRYLAACVAVGTIDQPLMGALRVRHAQLRSAAMLRLLLVVDEVHATDIYMTAILRHLLDQHRHAGGHTLLMSATLGAFARQSLLVPRGRVTAAGPAAAIESPYPAVWTDRTGLFTDFARPEAHEPKLVRIDLETSWSDPARIAALATNAARQGARVLIIRNTVNDVLAAQLALEQVAPDLSLAVEAPHGRVLTPHHARYAPEDRRRLDAALEAVLSADVARASRGSVTITSQTAEQSLDIDADLLITDLCPADVLLQRIGRLHRKRRNERVSIAGFEAARVILLAPNEAELAAGLDAAGQVGRRTVPLGLGLVYPDLLGVLATRRAVAAAATLSIPRDNRALVEAATHPELLQALAEELGGVWPKHWQTIAGIRAAQEGQAGLACLDWDKEIDPLTDLDERIRVRLGLDDRLIALPPSTIGPFGGEISRLTIPGRWLAGVPVDQLPDYTFGPDGNLSIRLGERSFTYDRLGLRRA